MQNPHEPTPPARSDRGTRLLVAGALVMWLAASAWCVAVLRRSDRLQQEVAENVVWLARADATHHEVSHVVLGATRAALEPVPTATEGVLGPEARAALTGTPLVDAVPAEVHLLPGDADAWKRSARALVASLDAVHDRKPGDDVLALLARLTAADAAFDEATTAVRLTVRARLGEDSLALAGAWDRLRELALAALVATLAAGIGLLRTGGRLQETRAARRALAEKDAYLRNLLANVREVIWALDREGVFTFVSPSVKDLYHREPEEVLGHSFAEFASPASLQQDRRVFVDVLRGATIYDYFTEHVRGDGRPVRMRVTAAPLRDADDRVIGVTGTAVDVTNVARMQERIVAAERMGALSALAGGVAHDINNLLTGVVGYSELLRSRGDLPQEADRHIQRILDCAARGEGLTAALLTFAERRPTKKKAIDLAAAVGRFEDVIRRTVPEDIRVAAVLPDITLVVEADRRQLDEALVNLVTNACEAMPEGGLVRVAVVRHSLGPGEAAALGLEPGSWAEVRVTDEGDGMDEETRTRACEPFYTTRTNRKAAGLGLATVHGIMRRHGGAITLEGEAGRGTRASLWFRVVRTAAASSSETEAVVVTLDGSGRTAVVFEDDPAVRETVRMGLEDCGFTVVSPATPPDMHDLATSTDAVDILVSDVRMPRYSGPQLAAVLRERFPDLPVLFISGYTGDDLEDDWLRRPRVGFLSKPFGRVQLVDALGKLLRFR